MKAWRNQWRHVKCINVVSKKRNLHLTNPRNIWRRQQSCWLHWQLQNTTPHKHGQSTFGISKSPHTPLHPQAHYSVSTAASSVSSGASGAPDDANFFGKDFICAFALSGGFSTHGSWIHHIICKDLDFWDQHCTLSCSMALQVLFLMISSVEMSRMFVTKWKWARFDHCDFHSDW